MKTINSIALEATEMDNIMSVCGGIPRGDELPQVAGEADILMDVYSDILNVPRDYAASRFYHQYDDDFEFENLIH